MASRSVAMGRRRIWKEPINDLPWYGQAPSMTGYAETPYIPSVYHTGYYGGQAYATQPYSSVAYPTGTMSMPHPYGGSAISQQPGYATVIHPGANGHPTHVEQIPSAMV